MKLTAQVYVTARKRELSKSDDRREITLEEVMRPLHHRMPVILQRETASEWLSGSTDYLESAAEKTPALRAWPVNRRVNNARNQGAELVEVDGEIID